MKRNVGIENCILGWGASKGGMRQVLGYIVGSFGGEMTGLVCDGCLVELTFHLTIASHLIKFSKKKTPRINEF